MVMQQRATTLYTQLRHHPPDLGKTDDAAEYAILDAALREVVEHASRSSSSMPQVGPQVHGVMDSDMLPTKLPSPLIVTWGNSPKLGAHRSRS
jgi:hypothetical protein